MVEIEDKKEELVVSWLRSHGYYKVVIEPSHIAIEADGEMRKMTVAVRTPENQENDIYKVKELAASKHREPWLAVVESDNYIIWEPL